MLELFVLFWIVCGIIVYGWCYYDCEQRWLAFGISLFGPISLLIAYIYFVRLHKRFDVIHLRYRSLKETVAPKQSLGPRK